MLPLPGEAVLLSEIFGILISILCARQVGITAHGIGNAHVIVGGVAAAGSPAIAGTAASCISLSELLMSFYHHHAI